MSKDQQAVADTPDGGCAGEAAMAAPVDSPNAANGPSMAAMQAPPFGYPYAPGVGGQPLFPGGYPYFVQGGPNMAPGMGFAQPAAPQFAAAPHAMPAQQPFPQAAPHMAMQAPAYGYPYGPGVASQPGAPASDHGDDGCSCSSGGSKAAGDHPGAPGNLKHDMNQYGQLYGMIREAADGSPDVTKFLNFFNASSSDFWKGALVGAGLTLLLSNDKVKGAISGGVANVWGLFSNSAEDLEAEEDRKAEERAAREE
jgi:hypothetical protein